MGDRDMIETRTRKGQMMPSLGKDKEFTVTWDTRIISSSGNEYPLGGMLLIEADTIAEAAAIADGGPGEDGLTDVDFFVPNKTYSASDSRVIAGVVHDTKVGSLNPFMYDLVDVFPWVKWDDYTFDRIFVRKVEEGDYVPRPRKSFS